MVIQNEHGAETKIWLANSTVASLLMLVMVVLADIPNNSLPHHVKMVVASPSAAYVLVQTDLGWLDCTPPCTQVGSC